MLTRKALEKKISVLEEGLAKTETPLAKEQLQAKLDAARKQLRELTQAEKSQVGLF